MHPCMCAFANFCMYAPFYVRLYPSNYCMSRNCVWKRSHLSKCSSNWMSASILRHEGFGTIYVYINIYIYVCMYVCMYVCIYVCIYIYIHVYIYIYIWSVWELHICIHDNIHTSIHATHTGTYKSVHMQTPSADTCKTHRQTCIIALYATSKESARYKVTMYIPLVISTAIKVEQLSVDRSHIHVWVVAAHEWVSSKSLLETSDETNACLSCPTLWCTCVAARLGCCSSLVHMHICCAPYGSCFT